MATEILTAWQEHLSATTLSSVHRTYLSLALLPMSGCERRAELTMSDAERLWDRTFSNLVLDLLRFELSALEGDPVPLPQARANASTVSLRCLLALEAAAPALWRRSIAVSPFDGASSMQVAREICGQVEAAHSTEERQTLVRSMHPLSAQHDEYLFMRSLQILESTFSFISLALRRTSEGLNSGNAAAAIGGLRSATRTLLEVEPIFSLLGTVTTGLFRESRHFSNEARAAQTRGYEVLGTLCRSPGERALDALAPEDVPKAKERVLSHRATLAESFAFACHTGKLEGANQERVDAAMTGLELAVLRWRKAHRKLAVRILGTQVSSPLC